MELTELILRYGLPFVTIAFIVVCLVGIVKIFTKGILNKKEVSETKKKWLSKLYMALALVFSYVGVCIYYVVVLKQSCWCLATIRDTGITWTITTPLYEIYKQFGGRKFLLFFVSSIQKLFKGKNVNVDEILSLVMNVLEQNAPLLTEVQKEAIKIDLTNKMNGTAQKVETLETEQEELTEEQKKKLRRWCMVYVWDDDTDDDLKNQLHF